MVTAIIVDDEQDGREVLSQILISQRPEISIVAMAADAASAHRLILANQPDLVFLDIQMPGQDGFTLLESLEAIPFEVIFVTSFEQYALTAIKFNALDYLLKPVDVKELTEAVDKAVRRIRTQRGYEDQVKNLLETLHRLQTPSKIAVHVRDTVLLIPVTDILYVEADGNYCRITTRQNHLYLTSRMLKEFEEYFGPSSPFLRINKSILINADFITRYSKGDTCVITMQNKISFEVSRRKKQDILDRMRYAVNRS